MVYDDHMTELQLQLKEANLVAQQLQRRLQSSQWELQEQQERADLAASAARIKLREVEQVGVHAQLIDAGCDTCRYTLRERCRNQTKCAHTHTNYPHTPGPGRNSGRIRGQDGGPHGQSAASGGQLCRAATAI